MSEGEYVIFATQGDCLSPFYKCPSLGKSLVSHFLGLSSKEKDRPVEEIVERGILDRMRKSDHYTDCVLETYPLALRCASSHPLLGKTTNLYGRTLQKVRDSMLVSVWMEREEREREEERDVWDDVRERVGVEGPFAWE